MGERPTGPAAFLIDPKLVEAREQERARLAERVAPKRKAAKATLDPKLAEAREATRKKEASLKGRSVGQPPPRNV